MFLASFMSLIATPLYAKNVAMQEVRDDYFRYVFMGRSDSLITISLYGTIGSARVSQNSDGSFNCRVSGLAISADKVTASERLEQRGKLIHESTHCLVVPYTRMLPDDGNDPLVRVANDLTILMAESASDARAVIEIYRKDGLSEADAYASMLIAYRSKATDVPHSTIEAIKLARELVTYDNKRVQSDSDAFYTALHIARWSAESTMRSILEEHGHDEMMSSASTVATLAAMDATVIEATRAFKNGRYENSAVTMREKYQGRAESDMHITLTSDGTLRPEPTLGDEHAHEIAELKTLIAASKTPEQLLAVEALTKYGLLSKNNLEDVQILFERWIRVFTKDNSTKREAARSVIAKVIADTKEIEGVSDLYDKVTYELHLTFE